VLHFKERLELATQKLQLGHEELQDDENGGVVGRGQGGKSMGNLWGKTLLTIATIGKSFINVQLPGFKTLPQ